MHSVNANLSGVIVVDVRVRVDDQASRCTLIYAEAAFCMIDEIDERS